MSDLINRQTAIERIRSQMIFGLECGKEIQEYYEGLSCAVNILAGLPSAEPEIIRCCKCVYWQQDTVRQNSNDAGWWNEALCKKHTIYGNEPHEAWVDADWYCADAERRTDE